MDYLQIAESKILNSEELKIRILEWKKNNDVIVFTNGCFDVMHYGHINYLSKAASLGDKLIIGLNSDSSVKKLKGESRPINNEYARAMMLASMIFVDAVVFFSEETPENLIKQVIPNILVKGGDYKINDIVGADFVMDNGGKVEIIPFVDGYSSTNIINNLGAQ